MSRDTLKRLAQALATAERTGALFVIVDLRDIRAVLAEVAALKRRIAKARRMADENAALCDDCEMVADALAPLPARGKRRRT